MNICKLLEEHTLQYQMPGISCAFYIMYFCLAYMIMRQLLWCTVVGWSHNWYLVHSIDFVRECIKYSANSEKNLGALTKYVISNDSSFDSDSVQIKFMRIIRRHFKINIWQ